MGFWKALKSVLHGSCRGDVRQAAQIHASANRLLKTAAHRQSENAHAVRRRVEEQTRELDAEATLNDLVGYMSKGERAR